MKYGKKVAFAATVAAAALAFAGCSSSDGSSGGEAGGELGGLVAPAHGAFERLVARKALQFPGIENGIVDMFDDLRRQ